MKYKITFLFIGLSVALHAQTINIDGTSYASISAAITASSNGDVIDITGTHTENLSWNNKNITIRGNDATTAIIDGGGNNAVIRMFGGTAQTVTFENLTIRNGGSIARGGGIFYDIGATGSAGLITLNNVIVENNSATNEGGAIAMLGGNLTLNNSIIRNNTSTNDGGGLLFTTKGTTMEMNINNSLIQGNSGRNGGGIYVNGNANNINIDLNLENTTLTGNTTTSGSGGAGGGAAWIKAFNSASNVDLKLVHVTTYNNSHESAAKNGLSFTGGGTAFTNVWIYNSIIVNAGDVAQRAVNWVQAKPIDIVNSILGGSNAAGTPVDGSSANNFLQDPAKNNLKGLTATQAGLTGVLSDEGGNTQVLPISPGSNSDNHCTVATGITIPTTDQRGYDRDDTPDAGAFEYYNFWNGTDTDWSNAANWDDGVPSSGDLVQIRSASNMPTATTPLNLNLMKMESGTSFITSSTFTGDLSYTRAIGTDNWYLVSSPVTGQDIDEFALSENLEEGTGNVFGLAPYNNDGTGWEFYVGGSTSSGNFVEGKGYSVLLASAGEITFKGGMPTSDNTSITLTDNSGASGDAFNLMGNPYPSHIALNNSANGTTNILDDNSALLEQETIWLWNQATSSYDIYNQATGAFHLAPGQGFWVKANGNSSQFSIVEGMQSHQTDTFQRNASPNPEIELFLSNGSYDRSTRIFYIDATTTGFDNGYDSSIFEGSSQNFAVYTQTVENSQERNLGIQSLPTSGTENLAIPVGVNAANGTTLTFSTTTLNLPQNMLVYLEDTELGTLTQLNEENTSYSTILDNDLNGIGRFYLRVTSQVLNTTENNIDLVSIYTVANSNEITIVGLLNGETKVSLFNINGQELLITSIQSTDRVHTISLPKISAGVYIAQVKNQDGVVSKKIIIN